MDLDYGGVIRDQELTFQGVFRLDPGNLSLALLADDFAKPNGLCFSPDEKHLFINDTEKKHIRAFDVCSDGTLTNSRVWPDVSGEGLGAPDGMKFNKAGQLFCTGPGGIHVFDSEANCLGIIVFPDIWVTYFAWGDEDFRSLFIITFQVDLFRLRLSQPGYKAF